MDKKPQMKNWSVNDYDDLLAGVRDAGELRVLDRRGMTPGLAAALDTGSASHRLMSLLDGPEAGEGESALSRIEELLAEQVEQGRLVLEKLDAVIQLLSPRMVGTEVVSSSLPGRRRKPQPVTEPQAQEHPLGG